MEVTGRIGKAASPLEFEISRELLPEDLIIRAATSVDIKPSAIKSLRALHHKLAQVLAMNFTDAEASIATGYSPSRISILKADPAFQDLLAFYATDRKEVFVDVQQRMAGFATTALEVLQERLEDKPDTFTSKDLNNLIKTTADRGGHSPVHKTENKTIVLTAQELKVLKEGVEAKQNGQVRKINQSEETQRVKQRIEGDLEPAVCDNDNGPSRDILQEAETPGSAGQGDNL